MYGYYHCVVDRRTKKPHLWETVAVLRATKNSCLNSAEDHFRAMSEKIYFGKYIVSWDGITTQKNWRGFATPCLLITSAVWGLWNRSEGFLSGISFDSEEEAREYAAGFGFDFDGLFYSPKVKSVEYTTAIKEILAAARGEQK